MKKIVRILVLPLAAAVLQLVSLGSVSAQSVTARDAEDEIIDDVNKAGGVYLVYSEPAEMPTPAPQGYKPFYLAHYGRHGSRYLLRENEYDDPVEILDKAYYAGKLTPLGEDVRTRMRKVYAVAKGRAGELTQVGARQHHDIAARMARNFPEIFGRRGAKITAWSSVVPRCIMSMAASCEGLKEYNPSLEITRDASASQMYKLHCFRADFNPLLSERAIAVLKNTDPEWAAERNGFKERCIDPARVVGLLFNDPEYASRNFDTSDFVHKMMLNAVSLQGLDLQGVSFYDLFTTDELYRHWRYMNFDEYCRFGPSAKYGDIILGEAKHMVREFFADIERALASGQPAASLRYGHDTSLMAMTALLQIDGCFAREADPEKVEDAWVNFRVAPMAANLQMIFYRKKGSDDVLVKILYNEREVNIPVPTSCAPYYRWRDVKDFSDKVLRNTK